ncbi:hypothetical protein HI914_05676 [Erysiphe necator]|nr:hypothetical protein HI914_05676 [Erysiphe necator]
MSALDIDKQYSDTFNKDSSRCDVVTPLSLPPYEILSNKDSRKRKRKGDALDYCSNDLFLLKPYPANVSVKSRTLQPLIKLPRSCLPLSFLDHLSSADSLGSTRLFKAHIKAIYLEGNQPMVLVARDEESKNLFALEREGRGLYAVCQVGSWVSLQKLQDAAGTTKLRPLKPVEQAGLFPLDTMSLKTENPKLMPVAKSSSEQKKRQVIEAIQSMVKKSSILPQTTPNEDAMVPSTNTDLSLDSKSVKSNFSGSSQFQSSSTEIFENIRTHYFEMLYLSKISLAYFVKGPLSRARAAFHKNNTQKLDPDDYCAFLHTLILPISLFNNKYTNGISNCILNFGSLNHSDDLDDTKLKKKEKGRNKNLKLGKNGLYHNENVLIKKWWTAHEDKKGDLSMGVTEISKDEFTKTKISELRIRETQLQIILILEALTFQALPSCTKELESNQPELSSETVKSKNKCHSPSDLQVLIDIYIDRLCIWQSVAVESLKDSQNLLEMSYGSTPYARLTESFLRDFCVEVILPFFSSRLPDQCSLISEKLGVPTFASQKTKNSKSSSSSHNYSKPGAATKRSLPLKSYPSLKQVLTRDRKRRCVSQSHGKAIALMRSATMPLISSVKKDEILSISDPTSNYSPDAKLALTQKRKNISQREINFSTLDLGNNQKEVGKLNVDMELREAISVLRKPSRNLVAKDDAHFAAQRAINLSHFEASKKLKRSKVIREGVQILVTPKSNRDKFFFDKIQYSNSPTENKSSLSSHQKLLSSPKATPHQRDDFFNNKSPFCSIQATPSQALASKIQKETPSKQIFGNKNYLCQSPLNVRRSSAQLFGSLSKSIDFKRDDECRDNIYTPKSCQVETTSQTSKFLRSESYKENESHLGNIAEDKSIYQVIGWVEDFG